jgi:hypothetical protein
MKSIRKFAYAAVLGLSTLTIQPTLVAAEDAHGNFTLSHEVHFQKIVLRPGDYAFSIKAMGASEFLMLRGLNGGTAAMLLVNHVETPKPNDASKLVLVSRDGQSFVSTMTLSEFDMTLRFAVPRESAETERASR